MAAESKNDQLSGVLEILVLRTLTVGPAHGYAIARHIEQLSEDVLKIEQGSLYPALDRLLRRGWVTARWQKSPTGRQARYYTITATGRKRLKERVDQHERFAMAIRRVLGTA